MDPIAGPSRIHHGFTVHDDSDPFGSTAFVTGGPEPPEAEPAEEGEQVDVEHGDLDELFYGDGKGVDRRERREQGKVRG